MGQLNNCSFCVLAPLLVMRLQSAIVPFRACMCMYICGLVLCLVAGTWVAAYHNYAELLIQTCAEQLVKYKGCADMGVQVDTLR